VERIRTIGTAGHVDHGKSALVKAITGIDPDRLKEEKEREMTIDLGFAWLTLPSGAVVSIVDVPGHESFIKNMLAGVGGIDAVLFVVAADEGVMPQTREHLDILDLLELSHGVAAITKADLIDDEEWLELVKEEVVDLLAGTSLAGSEVVVVSAVTGRGLDALLEQLDRLLEQVPGKRDIGRPRLPVDRVFVMPGFGTVVTGTLVDGGLQVGQEVEVSPSGLRARIRGLQTHKKKLESAVPGGRVAVNLGGISSEEVERGYVLTVPGQLESSKLVDTHLRMLERAPRPLKHNVEVEFFCGSAQIMARTRLLADQAIQPGQQGWVQFRLAEPAALVRGDHFVIRLPSPSLTIGGGVVVDPAPRRRHRRFRPGVIERLDALSRGSPEEILLQALGDGRPRRVAGVLKETGLPEDEGREALGQAVESSEVLVLGSDQPTASVSVPDDAYIISASAYVQLSAQIEHILKEYHRRYPLRDGMPREELKSRVNLPARSFAAVMSQASAHGKVSVGGTVVKLPGHEITFTDEQQRRIEELLARFAKHPHAPPSVAECEAAIGSELFSVLVDSGRLVKVSESVVFLAETYEEMVARVVDYIREKGSISVAEVRDMFGASRKYALALMENLDDRRVTKRVGDRRVLH
jgi:selenocysteine-specific elongation factor